jgi:hypothetical protein
MYWNAWRQRAQLGLNAVELIHTKSAIFENLNFVAVCALSIVLSHTADSPSLPGWIYGILGGAIAVTIAGWLGTRSTTRQPPLAVIRQLT